MPLSCVIFDLGSTLTDVSEVMKRVDEEFNVPYLKKLGYNISLEKWREARKKLDEEIDRNKPDIVKKPGGWMYLMSITLGINIPMEKCIEEEKAFDSYIIKNSKLMLNALKILNFLKDQGLKLVLLSNWKKVAVEEAIKYHNLLRFFNLIIYADEIGYDKSSLVPFKVALNELHYPPNEVIMVGDRLDEDAYCKRVGIKFVWFSKIKREFYRTIEGYDFEIKDLTELKPIVFNLMKS